MTYDPNKQVVNLGKETAAWCLDNIVMNKDLLSARKRIRSWQQESKLLKEKIQESKRITAGHLFKAGSYRIGKTIPDIQKENAAKKQQEHNDKFKKVTNAYLKDTESANDVRALNIAQMKCTVK